MHPADLKCQGGSGDIADRNPSTLRDPSQHACLFVNAILCDELCIRIAHIRRSILLAQFLCSSHFANVSHAHWDDQIVLRGYLSKAFLVRVDQARFEV